MGAEVEGQEMGDVLHHSMDNAAAATNAMHLKVQ
jgi:hypothetical protein